MLDIDNLIKECIKNKNSIGLKVYRNLKSDILVFKTQKNAPEYNELAEISLIKKYYSKMEDAEKQYSQANREDLASVCREELEILKQLLPKPVTSEEIYNYLQDNWSEDNKIIIPKKSMGIVIKTIKEIFPGADGKIISEIVKKFVI